MKTDLKSRAEIGVSDQRSSGENPDLHRKPPMKIDWRALGSWAVRGLIALTLLGVGGWWLTSVL